MAISGKVGGIYKQTDDAAVTFTDEATTADATNKIYTITSTSKRYWDKSSAVTVEVDGTAVTTGFYIEYAGGRVVFEEAQTEAVTVSGKYVAIAQIGGFFNWSLSPDVEYQDTTTFESDGWKEQIATIKSWSASADQYFSLDDELNTAFNAGVELIWVFFADIPNAVRFEGYGYISSENIQTAKNEVAKDTINFSGDSGIYFRAA